MQVLQLYYAIAGSDGNLELIEIGTVVLTGVDEHIFIYKPQENDDTVWRGQFLKASDYIRIVYRAEREVISFCRFGSL